MNHKGRNLVFLVSVWIAIALCLSSCVTTGPAVKISDQRYIDAEGAAIEYAIQVPLELKSDRRQPALLLLNHPRGGNGRTMIESWSAQEGYDDYILVAPTRETKFDADVYYRMLEDVARTYSVDRERISLVGISAGALISRWLVEENPAYWNRVALISASGDLQWTGEIKEPNLWPKLIFVHGVLDEQYAIESIKKLIEKLDSLEIQADLIPIEHMAHSNYPVSANRAILNWLLEREAQPTPE